MKRDKVKERGKVRARGRARVKMKKKMIWMMEMVTTTVIKIMEIILRDLMDLSFHRVSY